MFLGEGCQVCFNEVVELVGQKGGVVVEVMYVLGSFMQ